MKSQPIWLGYDMGLPGDYEAFFAWLDRHDAKPCGRCIAFLNYGYSEDLKSELLEELRGVVEITKEVSIYLIYLDPQDGKLKGSFVFGRRGWTPWHGYAGFVAADDC